MKYKIYTKKEILNRAIDLKEQGAVFALFFKVNHLSFGVHYEPSCFKSSINLSHFSFYALSLGFENFTETGYRSHFVQNSKNVASYREIKSYFMKQFDGKINFLKPVQLQLF